MIKNNFVFIIPYFNCKEDIEKTIFSIMSQSYDNWHAIMINDLSSDGSFEFVKKICSELPEKYKKRFTLINNEFKNGEVRNTLKAVDLTSDSDIICRLDGGDWLTENDLLYILNHVYQDEMIAVAWTAHRWSYTTQNISGPLNLDKGQTVYQHPWVSSHMKTFRSVQLKKVPESNFKDDEGNYIMIACDQAVFLPMMHISVLEGKKLQFVPIVGYHYNIDLTNKNLFTSERSIRQKTSAETIRSRGFLT